MPIVDSCPSTPVTGPPVDGEPRPTGAPDWFWVDLPRLRQAYLDAGFTERPGPAPAGQPDTVLLERGEIEVVIPAATAHRAWSHQAAGAIA